MKDNFVIFKLPCHVTIGSQKPKTIALNMNWYRNAHFQILNKVKQSYQPISGKRFRAEKISIIYTLHLPNHRRTDLMNWIAVTDKFFLDYLVENGCIADDCVRFYPMAAASAQVNPGIDAAYITAVVKIIERKAA